MLRDLSLRELHTLTILFFLLAYFDEQFVSKQKIWSNVSYSRKIQSERSCCAEDVKMISSSSLQLIERFRAEDEIVTNWVVVFLSTRWRWKRVWNLHRSSRWKSNIMSWVVSESIRSKNENIWFRKQIYTRKSNVRSRLWASSSKSR